MKKMHIIASLMLFGIIKAVEKTRKKYKGDKSIANAIGTFMQLAEFKSDRAILNITDRR